VKAALLVVLLSFLGAPFQCASDPDPARRMEDTPSEALWNLAERFEDEGHGDARRETLEEIVRSYPSSREGERARQVLSAPASADSTASAEPQTDAPQTDAPQTDAPQTHAPQPNP